MLKSTAMKDWGYWATLGWAVLAFFAGQFVALAVLLWRSAAIEFAPGDAVRRRHGGAVHADLRSDHRRRACARRAPRAGAVYRLSGAACGRGGDTSAGDSLARCPDRGRRCAALPQWAGVGYAVSAAILHDGSRAKDGFRPSVRRDHCCACGRGDHVPRIFVPRLGAFGSLGVAGDRRDLDIVGGDARPVRLDRHPADLHRRSVSRLDALAQRIDCC